MADLERSTIGEPSPVGSDWLGKPGNFLALDRLEHIHENGPIGVGYVEAGRPLAILISPHQLKCHFKRVGAALEVSLIEASHSSIRHDSKDLTVNFFCVHLVSLKS